MPDAKKHAPHKTLCKLTSSVELDAMVRLLAELVQDVECYCSEKPIRTCPVHEAEHLLTENDKLFGVLDGRR